MLLRWCSLAKPLLVVLTDPVASRRHPGSLSAVGMLLNGLGACLEAWVDAAPEKDAPTLQKQIAQHTAGRCQHCMSEVEEHGKASCKLGGRRPCMLQCSAMFNRLGE